MASRLTTSLKERSWKADLSRLSSGHEKSLLPPGNRLFLFLAVWPPALWNQLMK